MDTPVFFEKREALKKFFYEIKDCKKCSLSKSRTNFVFGSGNSDAEIMFVGEAPGRNEDLQGKPFVGRAGKILDELLNLIELERKDVFIANVLKCKPPQNRDPVPQEINTCKNYLFRQIDIIAPTIICTLGRYSTQLLLETDKSITGLRGRIFKTGYGYILPINHPAAVLYTPSRINVLKDDFLRLKELIKSLKNPQPDNNLLIRHSSGNLSGKSAENKIVSSPESQKNVLKEENTKKNQTDQMGLF